MAAKTIKINGVDMTQHFTPKGMQVTYKKIKGSLGGVMLDGSTVEDVLELKYIVTLTTMPLNDSAASTVLQAVTRRSPNPTLYFFDPRIGDYVLINTTTEVSNIVCAGLGGTRVNYWTKLKITFTEV